MPKTRSVIFNTLMQLILLMVTLVIYQKEALAICAYYPGVYDGSSYTAISTGGVRSGYNSYGQYGTFTCQTTSGHSYWSPDTSYVAASAAAPPPPPPPANTYFSVINNTSETVNCYDNGVSIGPYSSSTCYTPTRVGLTQVPDFQNPSYYDTYRLSYYNGYTETTAIYGRNGPGMSYQSYDVPPSGQVVVDQYTRSCTQPYPVQPGCPVTTCNAPWGGTVANGASITAYSTNVAPYGSSCQPQTRTCSSGALSGSYTAQSCYVAAPANCTATSKNHNDRKPWSRAGTDKWHRWGDRICHSHLQQWRMGIERNLLLPKHRRPHIAVCHRWHGERQDHGDLGCCIWRQRLRSSIPQAR